jgi:hypothetical protein
VKDESGQRSSLERPIRLLGTFGGVVLGGLGFVVGRISAAFLRLYHDLDMSVTWRQPTLGALSSLPTFAESVVLAIAVIIASWRLSLPRAAWLNFCLALMIFALLLAAVYFFFSLNAFVAGAIPGALIRNMMSF